MKNKTTPCKNCLILAVCKNKVVINCSILHAYLLVSSYEKKYDMTRKQLGDIYRFLKRGRVTKARKIYNEKGECIWL